MLTKLVTFVFIIFILFILYLANTDTLTTFLGSIYTLPYFDKVGHFVLIGTLAFLINLTLQSRKMQLFGRPVLTGSFWVTIVVILEELTQIVNPNRTFDWGDLLCDFLGIFFLGRLAAYLLSRQSQEPYQPSG